MTKDATTTIGMDLGDTWSVLFVLDESGEVVEQNRVVLAVGTHSPWMEWLAGESLSQRLARGGLGIADSIELVRRVAGALGTAHARGLVHGTSSRATSSLRTACF